MKRVSGYATIAHSAVKTKEPITEGFASLRLKSGYRPFYWSPVRSCLAVSNQKFSKLLISVLIVLMSMPLDI
ncbi:hypothetical protein IMCC3135_26630 [Granulosicoccus antarcticus IMCC3135]|uniref:Uncharacterized protein n=1 Tax=Granulosicoccus antarcticus IMCC3135 TaxID=1192854 RepID=A0A2Z2NZL0_9GAMM|nr:hypothetical protein IMCC3135_26630 [Granulosicoccus antarcticus IMCC3135]